MARVVSIVWLLASCGGASARGPDANADAARDGAARIEWRIVDGARDPTTCRDVGADVVRVIARAPAVYYEDDFECLQQQAVTSSLAAGRYDVELRLETDDGVVLADARTRGELGGALVDLGTVELVAGG